MYSSQSANAVHVSCSETKEHKDNILSTCHGGHAVFTVHGQIVILSVTKTYSQFGSRFLHVAEVLFGPLHQWSHVFHSITIKTNIVLYYFTYGFYLVTLIGGFMSCLPNSFLKFFLGIFVICSRQCYNGSLIWSCGFYILHVALTCHATSCPKTGIVSH